MQRQSRHILSFNDANLGSITENFNDTETIFKILDRAQTKKDSKQDTTIYSNQNSLNKSNPSYKNTFNSKTYVNKVLISLSNN